jgi:hypothetical protein
LLEFNCFNIGVDQSSSVRSEFDMLEKITIQVVYQDNVRLGNCQLSHTPSVNNISTVDLVQLFHDKLLLEVLVDHTLAFNAFISRIDISNHVEKLNLNQSIYQSSSKSLVEAHINVISVVIVADIFH